jgi:hypothetical protein
MKDEKLSTSGTDWDNTLNREAQVGQGDSVAGQGYIAGQSDHSEQGELAGEFNRETFREGVPSGVNTPLDKDAIP